MKYSDYANEMWRYRVVADFIHTIGKKQMTDRGPGQPKKERPATFALTAYTTSAETQAVLTKVKKDKLPSVSKYLVNLIRKDLKL